MSDEAKMKKEQIEACRKKVIENRGKNADETIRYCSDMIECADKIDDEEALGFAYFYKGETYYALN